VIGILIAAAVLFLFNKFLPYGAKLAQTVAFTSIVVLEMARVQMVRSRYHLNWFSNKWLILSIAGSILLQLVVVYVPFMNQVFKTVPLGLFAWTWILLITIVVYLIGHMLSHWIARFTKQFD